MRYTSKTRRRRTTSRRKKSPYKVTRTFGVTRYFSTRAAAVKFARKNRGKLHKLNPKTNRFKRSRY